MKRPLSRRGFLRGALATGAATSAVGAAGQAEAAPPEEAPAPEALVGRDAVAVSTTVNGQPHALTVHPDDVALHVLRERLGLTGAKEACGHGACGACTALVDGAPHATCLLPAVALEGREVTTVEGLPRGAVGADLHPVQRAFLAHDALQCGFCTPGFVVEAAAFCDAWRAEHGDVAPSRDAVAEALAGHLCRCGAYAAIYRAVQSACAGHFDGVTGAAPVVGPRHDALEKVTGRAEYTVDVQLDGQRGGRLLRADVAHGRLRALDLAPALALPGVLAAVRLLPEGGTIRWAGQALAAVAAADRRAAAAALAALTPDIEPLPAALTLDDARAPDAPLVYPGIKRAVPNAAESFKAPGRWRGNVRGPVSSALLMKPPRAVQARLNGARDGGLVLEGVWTTQVQCHSSMEPHAAVAWWRPDRLTVWASTQSRCAAAGTSTPSGAASMTSSRACPSGAIARPPGPTAAAGGAGWGWRPPAGSTTSRPTPRSRWR